MRDMINFCSGPSKLPDIVYNKLPGMIRNYQATGLSLLSISHRDPIFLETYYGIKRCLQKLLNLSENYAILLMPGGGDCTIFCYTTQSKETPENGLF